MDPDVVTEPVLPLGLETPSRVSPQPFSSVGVFYRQDFVEVSRDTKITILFLDVVVFLGYKYLSFCYNNSIVGFN